jgi:2-oxoglutarate ferredoxin oxidoreductase subunit delta
VHIPIPEHEDRCTKCQVCSLLCPDQAIKVDEEDES